MSSHRPAILTIICAVIADVLCGLLYAAAEHIPVPHALYCAVGNAVTEGACTAPATSAGHWIAIAEFLCVVPLVAATFSLFTAAVGAVHLGKAESRLTDHVTSMREGVHEALSERMADLHEKVAELQVAYGNGALAEFHARLEDIAEHLHERLDGIEAVISGEEPIPVVSAEPEGTQN